MLGDFFRGEERAALGGGAVECMDNEALLGRMLERRRGLLALRSNREVVLRMRKQVKLRGTAGPDQCESEK